MVCILHMLLSVVILVISFDLYICKHFKLFVYSFFIFPLKEWMIDDVVVPVATGYGLAKEYQYLKSSIKEFLTGW